METSDVCVVGSGPAGLAVALRCAARGKSVLLVESGDGSDRNSLNDGDVVAAESAPDRTDPLLVHGPSLFESHYMNSGRLRAPGGCSEMWGVRARVGAEPTVRISRPDRIDFQQMENFDTPNWPVEFEEVSAYLDEAASFFDLPGATFDPPDDAGFYSLDSNVFEPKYFHFARATVIHADRLADVRNAANIEFRPGWTLVDIETGANTSRIERLTFVDMHGERFRTSPAQVVLATGGVENARTLLNWVDEGQLTDPHDTLGRWFMDHPHSRLGVLIPDGDILDTGRFHDFRDWRGRSVLGHYALSHEATLSEGLLRFSMTLVGAPLSTATSAAAAGARLIEARHSGMSPKMAARQLFELAKDPRSALAQFRFKLGRGPRHHTALGGWSDSSTQVTDVGVLAVEAMSAQRPSPDNRIRLSDKRCHYGKRQARLQWSWSEPEVDSYWRSVDLAREHFSRLNAGQFVGAQELGSGRVPRAGTGWHQMGGTRMSAEPEYGVVDADCRHHQTQNLFLAGSSIFASSIGYANPTLTLVAFALRLGDHLCGHQQNA